MESSQYPNLTTKTAEHLERYRKGKVANDNISEANVWNDLSIPFVYVKEELCESVCMG